MKLNEFLAAFIIFTACFHLCHAGRPGRQGPLLVDRNSDRQIREESSEECGVRNYWKRVRPTQQEDPGEFPWLAYIGIDENNEDVDFCIGTLISRNIIITHAHCITSLVVDSPVTDLYVRLGQHDRSLFNTEWVKQLLSGREDPNVFQVYEMQVHEDFKPRKDDYSVPPRSWENNIALLRIADVNPTDSINPICLPSPDLHIGYRQLTIADWGRYNSSEFAISNTVLKRHVGLWSGDKCGENFYKFDPKEHLCYGYVGGFEEDNCHGSYGSPMAIGSDDGEDVWFLIGIFSFRNWECGTKGYVDVYTRIEAHLTWIGETSQTLLAKPWLKLLKDLTDSSSSDGHDEEEVLTVTGASRMVISDFILLVLVLAANFIPKL